MNLRPVSSVVPSFTKLQHVRQLYVKNAYTELYENPSKSSVADTGPRMEKTVFPY
jgi:hypothetical protein